MNSAKTPGNTFVAQNQGSSVQLQSTAEFRRCNNWNSPLAHLWKGQSKSKPLTLCKAYSNKLTASSSYPHPISLFHSQSHEKKKCNKLVNISNTWSYSQVEQLYCDACPSWTRHIPSRGTAHSYIANMDKLNKHFHSKYTAIFKAKEKHNTFFFNHFSVFSGLYLWNFWLPISEKKQARGKKSCLVWIPFLIPLKSFNC